MKFARRQRQEAEINLTPLIDVVFLLLIFFMVSTTFTRQTHLLINLPVSSLLANTDRMNQIEITITRQGDYAVNGVPLVDRDAATLSAAIEVASHGDESIRMVISADAASPHQALVTAMSLARELGFTQLQLTTTPPD